VFFRLRHKYETGMFTEMPSGLTAAL